MLREGLGLDGGHEEEVVPELLLVIPLPRAGEGGDEAAVRQVAGLVDHHFAHAEIPHLEAAGVATPEDPAFELEATVLDALPPLDPEELRVHRPPIDEHAVGLEAGGLRPDVHGCCPSRCGRTDARTCSPLEPQIFYSRDGTASAKSRVFSTRGGGERHEPQGMVASARAPGAGRRLCARDRPEGLPRLVWT